MWTSPTTNLGVMVQIDVTKLCVANTISSADTIALVAADITVPLCVDEHVYGVQECATGGTTMGAGLVPGVTYCSCYSAGGGGDGDGDDSSSSINMIGFSLLAILASLWN